MILEAVLEIQQIIGGIEALKNMSSQSFDVIICHNVMEYLNDRDIAFFITLFSDREPSQIPRNKAAG